MFKEEMIIFTDATFQDKKDLIYEMTHLKNKDLYNSDAFYEAVKVRESLISTYIGHEIAIPHAISDAVEKAFVIYMRLNQTIPWDQDALSTVKHVFMIGVPPTDGARQHLLILSELSKNLMRDTFRQTLNESNSVHEIYKLLKNLERGMAL